ncbi:MAG TPA: extracellular solute-binding protein [Burkholderiaceae bacterium]|jgi:putrescine transport system substrate-binding protein|nr:extracellular solute-binding protein [Burkholderiaceae bacterium]
MRVGVTAAAILQLAVIAGCGPSGAAQHSDEKVLNVYNWSDYVGETTVQDFEKETGIRVRYDTFDANETLYAKLVAGHTGYDIVVPSSHWAKLELESGLLKPLDKSKITTYSNIDPWILKQLAIVDPGNRYVVPWAWGITTIGINVDRVKAALGSLPMPSDAWDLVFKPEYASKLKVCGVSFLDSADEVFPSALRYQGKPPYSNHSADYQEAARMLSVIRPYVTLFSSSGYINEMASGSVCVAIGWSSDIALAAARAREARNGQNIQVLLPRSGAVLYFDTMAIPVDASHVENAYRWMSYIYRPQVQAGVVNKAFTASAVRAADRYIRPEVMANRLQLVEGENLDKLVPPDAVANDVRRLRTRLYTTFKTGL